MVQFLSSYIVIGISVLVEIAGSLGKEATMNPVLPSGLRPKAKVPGIPGDKFSR